MRSTYSVIYIILIIALLLCCILARRSVRPTKNAVAFLESALIPPVLGNLLIVGTASKTIALIGCYFYYLGMDLVMYALVIFTDVYCRGNKKKSDRKVPAIINLSLAADAVQMALNPIFGHAFTVQAVDVEGVPYYKLVPYLGQAVHRIVDYSVFISVMLVFIVVTAKAPRISREKFTVVLITMAAVGLVQTYNIFFQYAIDRSMVGYGIFGVVIFYFTMMYRPLRLLDRVLSNIVSGLSDAFYIFDPNGSCIWANDQGYTLVGINPNSTEELTDKLIDMFGDPGDHCESVSKHRIDTDGTARFYILEEKRVKDENGRLDGTFLRVQDITEGEKQLMDRDIQIGQISQEAYRDSLTGVGSKAAYIRKVAEINSKIGSTETEFAVVMMDMNNLKQINDDYGHKAGDIYIKGCCHMICETFKNSPVYRIGGDEFVALLQGKDFCKRAEKTAYLRKAFAESFDQPDKDPWLRYSAAVGLAEFASDDSTYELVFKRADKAMYEDKNQFKEIYGSYR